VTACSGVLQQYLLVPRGVHSPHSVLRARHPERTSRVHDAPCPAAQTAPVGGYAALMPPLGDHRLQRRPGSCRSTSSDGGQQHDSDADHRGRRVPRRRTAAGRRPAADHRAVHVLAAAAPPRRRRRRVARLQPRHPAQLSDQLRHLLRHEPRLPQHVRRDVLRRRSPLLAGHTRDDRHARGAPDRQTLHGSSCRRTTGSDEVPQPRQRRRQRHPRTGRQRRQRGSRADRGAPRDGYVTKRYTELRSICRLERNLRSRSRDLYIYCNSALS